MPLFDTSVQELKYKVLREVAKLSFEDELNKHQLDIAKTIIPDGSEPTMRCCIYKERAIVNDRVKLAMGGDETNPNVVEVLQIACDECPVDGIQVSQACRGCIAHRCANACPRHAITIVNHKATIDKSKCIECGKCMTVCPYSAIVKNTRPCVNACKPKAITIDQENQKAVINNEKCISCGACVYQCPFGAISDKSYITRAIRFIKESENNTKYKVYAVVAPAIASQYDDVPLNKVVAGLKALGFHWVVEAALGADVVAWKEAKELAEKKFLTSSCCPAFVNYINKNYPTLKENVSHNYSPMAEISSKLKSQDPTCKIVFIGPCIAKKDEIEHRVNDVVDCCLTFEEMQALFSAKNIDLASLEGVEMDDASSFGRGFAKCGGLATAVVEALKEMNITSEEFELKPLSCNGILECNTALLKASKGFLKENFIEGMACEGGCIGGPACLSHSPKGRVRVDSYGKQAMERTIRDAITTLEESENP